MTTPEKIIEFPAFVGTKSGKELCRESWVQQSHAGRFLAFTDDDVIVGRRWLTEILNEFDRDPVLGWLLDVSSPLNRGAISGCNSCFFRERRSMICLP